MAFKTAGNAFPSHRSAVQFASVCSIFLAYLSCAEALYSASGPVKLLGSSEFTDEVVNSHDLHLVEFFAPWCGHCKSLAPEYEKVAKSLRGIASVVAVEDQKAMQAYDVKGFPTIKIFVGRGKGKSPKTFDYSGAREAGAILDFVHMHLGKLARARFSGKIDEGQSQKPHKKKESETSKKHAGPSKVIELTDANFEKLTKDEDHVWFVEFYAPWCGHCKALVPQWDALAEALDKKVMVAKVDSTKHQMISQRFGIQGFPTLKLFPVGKKSVDSAIEYQGPRTSDEMAKFALDFYGSTATVAELVTQKEFDACEDSLCILAVLPHILDSKKEGRNAYLKTLNEILRASLQMPLKFFWIQGGDQFDLESALNLAFGFPAVVAVHLSKGKYSVHRGDLSRESVSTFLQQLLGGRAPVSSLPKLKPLVTHTPWDGEDAKPIKSEDDEL